jgi:hypothetical protein
MSLIKRGDAPDSTFSDSPCLERTLKATAAGIVVGGVAAAFSVLARRGSSRVGTMAQFSAAALQVVPPAAMIGGMYSVVSCTSEAYSGKSAMNAAMGGCAAGLVLGASHRSMQTACLGCLGFGFVAGMADVATYFSPAVGDRMALSNKAAPSLQPDVGPVSAMEAFVNSMDESDEKGDIPAFANYVEALRTERGAVRNNSDRDSSFTNARMR